MKEWLYEMNSLAILGALLTLMVTALVVGGRIGRSRTDASALHREQASAVQASILGTLALMLGFTFSIALERFNSRSLAVVDEANAIGTTWLRAQFLPDEHRPRALLLLRDYADIRLQTSKLPFDGRSEREALLAKAENLQTALWEISVLAIREEPKLPASLFAQALNETIDSYGRRVSELNRHVPELVLIVLFGSFVVTGGIIGFVSSLSGAREKPSGVVFVMFALLSVLMFMIMDLDRPQRGFIHVDLHNLEAVAAQLKRDTP